MPLPPEPTFEDALGVLELSLFKGDKMRAFLSGGGLRVVSMRRDNGEETGYGEHPHIDTAMVHLAEDIEAGCRPYGEAYGPNGVYTTYLTGASDPNSQLDKWLRRGQTFDAFAKAGRIVFELHGYEDQQIPEDLKTRVMETKQPEEFEARGYRFRVSLFIFPGNGDLGVSMETLTGPENQPHHRANFYKVVRRGEAWTLGKAMASALQADPEEVIDPDE